MTKGFTLVELLAVIVILAVLALIATPVVLSIIDDAKESAMLRSAEMYLSGVENAVMRENMNSGGNFRPNECSITIEGNLDCEGKDGIIEVEVNGEKPKNGSIVFENGKIKEVTLTYESGTIVKDASGNLVYSNEQSDSGSKEETLVPGLYKLDGTFISWDQLIADGDLVVENGELKSSKTCAEANGCGRGAWTDLEGKLVIDDSVTKISNCAFGCDVCWVEEVINAGLEIIIPNSVTYIGEKAFVECINLTSITIPDSVTYIGSGAFTGCTSLVSATISSNITDLNDRTFVDCENLTTFYFSGTIEQWNSIESHVNSNLWNMRCGEITVHCSNGDVTIEPGVLEP